LNTQSIIAPVIQDREALEDFADALIDRAPEIERDVTRLKKTPGDRDLIADLFRAIHNIKGDASLCKFDLAVAITHPIETLMARFREGALPFSDLLAELILLAVDRLELATEAMLSHKSLEHLHLLPMIQGLENMANASADEIDQLGANLIEEVTGFRPVAGKAASRSPRASVHHGNDKATADDLQFFRSLALAIGESLTFVQGAHHAYTSTCSRNQQSQAEICSRSTVQLEAASVCARYRDDACCPKAVWLKVGRK
jgi:chemotaxis protein histidine kinase CheA